MTAEEDKEYINWWKHYGEMMDCSVEYSAWKAGRAYQHQYEKSAQQSVQPTIATAALEDGPFETGMRRNAVVLSNRNSG